MLTQTKEVRDAWRASQRTLDIKVAVSGKTYTATDINSLKYDSGAYTGDTFAIGSTYSNSVQIEFSHLIENLKLGMEVLPSIGIKTSSGYVYEPLGVFIISSEIKMDRNNNLTSISASDRFCGLEGSYKSKLAYPAKVLDVIAEICEQSGVKANVDNLARLPHQADLPRPITGQTYRKALGWIAQLYAGYATFDRKGLFTIRTIAEPNYELDPSQYEQAGLTKNEAPYRISGIQCQTTITTKTRDGEDTDETKNYQVGDTNGSQIKFENNIMTPDRLTNIWEQIKDVNFYPFSLNWFGNPAIEAGDWLKLQDKQGNKFIVPNNSYTLDFNGGLSATSKADQTSSTDSVIAWEGTFSQTIRELQDRKAPDGTVIFPPSVTEPPTNAKPNDVWFKQNGNSTELWVFTEQEDGTRKWIRRDLTPDEIKKQVQEAQDGLKDAKKEIADNLAKADSDIAELNASIDNQNSKIDGLSTSVNTVVIPKVTDITNQVSDVDHKVSGVQSQITQNANNINLKVNAVGDLSNICLNPNFDDGSTAGWENISSSTGNSISPSKYYGGISIRDGFYGNMFSVSAGDKYYFSIYAWQDQSSHNFSVGFTYLQKDGSWNWQSALTFSPSESGREKTGAITIPSNAVKARIWVQIDADSDYGHWWFTNVNVRKNDTLAQINMSAGTTLIQNDKIYMDASSTVFSGKAFIPNAAITNISADKINAGTLDAGRINVINLNANNITTGTINGANLKINLNDGEILFQKGRIASTNGNLNIDLDNGTMSVTNYWGMGVFFQNGQLILDDRNSLGLAGSYSDANPKYGIIKRSYDLFSSGLYGMDLLSPNGVSLKTTNYDGIINSGTMLDSTTSGAVMTVDKNGSATVNAAGTTHLVGGNKFKSIPSDNSGITTNRPHIWIGNFNGDVGDRIEIEANYVHMPTTYWRTTGAAPNLHIADDGALVRSTSASKYKTNIKRSYSTEYGDKLLNLPTAIWTDKGQKERYEAGKRHIKPEKYFGMIAEDLADAELDLLVSRNPKTHEIEGIQYERIAPALLPVIKKLKDKVNRLEKQINE